MNEDDLDYFMRRANEERQRADASSDAAIEQIHRELATHYEEALAFLHKGATMPVETDRCPSLKLSFRER